MKTHDFGLDLEIRLFVFFKAQRLNPSNFVYYIYAELTEFRKNYSLMIKVKVLKSKF